MTYVMSDIHGNYEKFKEMLEESKKNLIQSARKTRTEESSFDTNDLPDEIDLAVMDLSFISLRLILPAVYGLLKDHGQAVCLVKPQFEAGREKVGKKGVVRDPAVHVEVLEDFLVYSREAGFSLLGLDFSPIRGPEGNIEYLGFLSAGQGESWSGDLKSIVEESHAHLEGEHH